MYALVEFDDRQCAVVPMLWLNNDNSKCFWPKVVKDEEAYEKLVQENCTPKTNWSQYPVKKVLFIGETYEESNKRLNIYIEESETESGDDSTSVLKKKVQVQLLDESYESQQSFTSLNSSVHSSGNKRKITSSKKNESFQKKNKCNKDRFFTSDGNDTEKSNSSFEDDKVLPKKISLTETTVLDTATTPETSSFSVSSVIVSSPAQSLSLSGIGVIEHQLVRDLEIIKTRQEQQTLLLDELLRTIRTQTIETLNRPPDMPNLPVNNKQEFKALEEFLTDEEKFSFMKRRVAAVGGSNLRSTTMNMLKFLISNKVAMNFNWAGRDKRPFKNTKIMGLIYDGVKLAYYGKDFGGDVSDKNIATAVKDWLKLAKYRYSYQLNKNR